MDCPISWCLGYINDHGADGAPPEEWLHSAEPMSLAGGAWIARERRGAGDDGWYVSIDEYGESVGDLAPVIMSLRTIAASMERISSPHGSTSHLPMDGAGR
jgi:hypothetical protein